jgi:dihydroorotase
MLVVTLQVHGEVADSSVDIFDRERVFIETVLEPLVRKNCDGAHHHQGCG